MYQGVKEFIASFREPFDRDAKALKKAKERMKEKGVSYSSKAGKELLLEEVELVLAEWEQKAQWGTLAHDTLQDRLLKKHPDTIKEEYKKVDSGISHETVLDVNNLKPNTRYLEKLLVDPLNHLIGRVDELYIDKKWNIHVTEYKSSNNLNRGFTYMTPRGPFIVNYFHPVSHLVDCNFTNANLQASMYMYLIWYYNKKLKPGTITIKHILLDENDGKILSEKDYKAPYLLEEVKQLLKHNK